MTQREDIILEVKIDEGDAVDSIDSIRKATRELTKERNASNLATEEGQKRVQALNKQIDANNARIKANIDALQKQRLNVGNYSNDIKKAAGELNLFGTNVGQVTTRLESFANPATAVVGIVGALTAAYAQSAAGARDLESATDQLSNSFTVMGNSLAKLLGADGKGGGLLSRFAFELNSRVFGTGAAVSGLIVANAKQTLKELELLDITSKRIAKEQLDFAEEQRRIRDDNDKTLNERLEAAKSVETFINARELELVNIQSQKISQYKVLLSQNQNNIELQKIIKQLEFEIADINEDSQGKRTEALNGVRAIEKAIADQRLLQVKKEQEQLNKQSRREKAASKEIGGLIGIPTSGLLPEDKLVLDSRKKLAEDIKVINEDLKSDQEAYKEAYILNERLKFEASEQLTAELSGLFKQGSAEQKAFALTAIGIDTAEAISSLTAASEANPANAFTFGAAGTAQFIAGLVRILTNIASAKNVLSAAAGGGDFITKGPALLMVGDNPGGRERVTVEPISGRGKTRVAKGGNLIAMAGGGSITSVPDGRTVTNSLTNDGGAMMAVLNAIRSMPPPEISIKEVTKTQNRIRVKENLSRL